MKILRLAVLLLLLAYVVWPYVTVLRLDRALAGDDPASLEHLVDLEAVQQEVRQRIRADLEGTVGDDSNPMFAFLKGGIRQLGDTAIDRLVTIAWVREQLLSKSGMDSGDKAPLLSHISFAFFESFDTFLLRIGRLGAEPVHVRLKLEDWDWRITAVYD